MLILALTNPLKISTMCPSIEGDACKGPHDAVCSTNPASDSGSFLRCPVAKRLRPVNHFNPSVDDAIRPQLPGYRPELSAAGKAAGRALLFPLVVPKVQEE